MQICWPAYANICTTHWEPRTCLYERTHKAVMQSTSTHVLPSCVWCFTITSRLTSALEQLSQKFLRDRKRRMCFQQHPICDDAFSLRRTNFSDFPPVRDDDSCIMQLSVEASEEWEKRRRDYSWQLWSSLETRSQKSPAMTQPVVGCVFMFVCVPVHLCVSVVEE